MDRSAVFFHRAVAVWMAVLLLPACAAVREVAQQPFSDYQTAIAQLSTQSEQALQQATATELKQFKAAVLAGDKRKIAALDLQFPPDLIFGWCYPGASDSTDSSSLVAAASQPDPASAQIPSDCGGAGSPLFAQMAAMQQNLAGLNQLLLSYASLLQSLAGAETTEQFNPATAAQNFTEQSQSFLNRIHSLGGPDLSHSSRDFALFSTLTANLAEQYLAKRRKQDLAAVLESGLAPLNKLVGLAQRALDITAQSVKTQYQKDSPPLLRAAITANDGGAALDQLLAANDQLQAQLKLLESLNQAYAALPRSQQELIAAVNESRSASLTELIVYASQIRQQYDSLRQLSGSAQDSGKSG